MEPPWSLRIEDEAPLTLVAVVRGQAWIGLDRSEPVPLGVGDVALVRGPDHYVVADDPATQPYVVIHPGQRCTTLRGDDLAVAMGLGVRTWGNSAHGATVLLTGTYEGNSEVSRRLLSALPSLVALPAGPWSAPLITLLAEDVSRDDPGQEVMLDRLLDLLVVAAIRAWFSEAKANAPTWWAAEHDPIVGRALRLIYNDPARSWTIAELASSVGLSRAGLARRFKDLVGESPIAFLTNWRLALAADMLREPGTTIEAVARQVGYSSPFALSTAFKRAYGVSPRQHRMDHRSEQLA
jgi:AraC-like DNA-binding protein